MSEPKILFCGWSSRSNSPRHAFEHVASVSGGFTYRSLCGCWVTTDGGHFHVGTGGNCPACERALSRKAYSSPAGAAPAPT